MIYQIAYWSKASAPMSQAELGNLASQCRQYNQQHNITGFLLYGNHTFFQIIEGDYQQVANLYQHLAQDKRHYDLLKIGEWCMTERQYPNFAMGFSQLEHPCYYPDYQHLMNWRSEQFTENKLAMRRLLLAYANLKDSDKLTSV